LSIWTREELEQQIAEWKKALTACSKGQSYSIEGRDLTRSDLSEIRKTLKFLEAELARLDKGTGPFFLPGRPKR